MTRIYTRIRLYMMPKLKKVLPIKLAPDVYRDLKFVIKRTNRSMAEIILGYFAEPVREGGPVRDGESVRDGAQKIRSARKVSLKEHAAKYAFTGSIAYPDKTDDEVAYLISNGYCKTYLEH